MLKPERNFSMKEYWIRTARERRPLLRFGEGGGSDFAEWHKSALAKLNELLGELPERVPLNPEIEYSVHEDGLIRERIIIDTERHMSVPMIALYPKTMKQDGTNAAILCVHGHGDGAKHNVTAHKSNPSIEASIAEAYYDYAYQMARAGFFTLSPDLRGFGERKDDTDYNGRDHCNVNFIKGAIMGIYTLTGNIHDMRCCVDYLCSRPEIDNKRIGMMGLSGGGAQTAFTVPLEPRIAAADIICYVNPFEGFAIQRANFCGMQMLPEIYKWLDVDDIAGLIAPRPLLIEMGIYDDCFFLEDTIAGYRGVERIYSAAGASERLESDIFPGPHAFGGNRAAEFFKRYL